MRQNSTDVTNITAHSKSAKPPIQARTVFKLKRGVELDSSRIWKPSFWVPCPGRSCGAGFFRVSMRPDC